MIKPYDYRISRQEHSYPTVRNNTMVKRFLKSDCDVMVKMDIDQKYPPHYFEFMVPLVEKHKVIGPLLYNKWRSRAYVPLMFEDNLFPYMPTPMTGYSGIVEVPYPHTNLFYAREVLENITPPWYDKMYNDIGTTRKNDMDFYFLDKIKAQGYKLYINTAVEVEHLVLEGVNTRLHNRWHRL